MSVEYGVELVDWKKFQKLWAEHGDASFFYEAQDEGDADWIIPLGPQPHWQDSWKVAIDFSDAFKELRQYLTANDRQRFEAFFLAFCLSDDNESFVPPRDLGEDVDEEIFFSTISPETARRYLDLWEKLDMESLRSAFAKIKPRPDGHMETFEHFKRYPEMWADLLRDAVRKKAGIVLTLA